MKTKSNKYRPAKPVTTPNRDVAERVLAVVDMGLVRGVGKPIPGKMCVEAAVCFAMGQDHGDQPNCVISEVRDFKIALNDKRGWPNIRARARGLRALSIAQLGSNQLKRDVFNRAVVEATILAFTNLLIEEAQRRSPDKLIMRKLRASITEFKAITYFGRNWPEYLWHRLAKRVMRRTGFRGKTARHRFVAKIGLDALILANTQGVEYLDLLHK